MKRITRYHSKMRVLYIAAAVLATLVLALFLPEISHGSDENGYYVVVINGKKAGAAKNEKQANQAYLNARMQINKESEDSVFLDVDFDIYKQDRLFGETQTTKELEAYIYQELSSSIKEKDTAVYVVNIDGTDYTLASISEVEALLDAAKAGYDEGDLFHTEITTNTSRFTSYAYNLVKAETAETNTVTVSSDGSSNAAAVDENAEADGMKEMAFAEEIRIVESYTATEEVMKLEDAIEAIVTKKDENQTYVVKAGDTLSRIAKLHGLTVAKLLELNDSFSEEDYIQIGDELIVVVAVPELSVQMTEQQSYREEYDKDIEYIYDDTKYTTYSETIEEGVSGIRDVVALVNYMNGQETERTIIEETIIEEASAKVVKVGTLTPPRYVKPISGGRITSRFGWRILYGKRDFHGGVDWGCPVGTSVRASSAGTVVKAGWGGSYGYYVLLKHPDGRMTRYAHLSKILVKKGQSVKQNQRIAYSGNTGNSTGPHLHFEMIINGERVNALKYLG